MITTIEAPAEDRAWRKDPGAPRHHERECLPRRGWYLGIKAGVEFGLAAVLLVLSAPVLAFAALLIKLTSRGPIIYSQIRLGLHGQPYTIFKLRTMTHNCEKASGPLWSTKGDSRVTWFGRFLRRSHLDELPQLWNVLKGEMSLIGPRPERPEFFPKLERALPRYRDRLHVRPGVTGLSQVQLPPDTDLASVRRKLAYDLFYVRQVSPWMDVQILLCTALHTVGFPYRFLSFLLLMPQRSFVERAAYGVRASHLPVPHMQAV